MRQAIAHSCNYYFYEVGRVTYDTAQKEVGYNPFDVIAKALGLGEPTGVELDEETGMRANAETKKEMYVNEDSGWYGADVLQAVIGQSLNRFTPMQMCSYVQALANQGYALFRDVPLPRHLVGLSGPDSGACAGDREPARDVRRREALHL